LLLTHLKSIESFDEDAKKKQKEACDRAVMPLMRGQTEFSVIDYDCLALKIASRYVCLLLLYLSMFIMLFLAN
jgi:hypothetical protein